MHAAGWTHGSVPDENLGSDEGRLTDVFICPEAVADRLALSTTLLALAAVSALATTAVRRRIQ